MIFSLLMAFVTALVLNNTVFYANSPNINPQFIVNLKSIPNTVINIPNRMIALIPNLQTIFPTQAPVPSTNQGTEQMNKENMAFTQPTKVVQPTAAPQPTAIPTSEYKPITTGVYAAEDPVTKVTRIRIDAGVKVEEKTLTYTQSDGTQTTIKLLIPVTQ